jgi:NDP-4-keto-2,6-dideoxyhexose 3-C-methyltransferase
LVKCVGVDVCGLVQLANSFPLDEMYGENYGYRSGLNPSMGGHLASKVRGIERLVDIRPDDLIIDIGSNDATMLRQYAKQQCMLVGVDPTGEKFSQFYSSNIKLIPQFFRSR